jgi:hypothetical protein
LNIIVRPVVRQIIPEPSIYEELVYHRDLDALIEGLSGSS